MDLDRNGYPVPMDIADAVTDVPNLANRLGSSGSHAEALHRTGSIDAAMLAEALRLQGTADQALAEARSLWEARRLIGRRATSSQ